MRGQSNAGGLVERDGTRLGGRLDVLGGLTALQRAPLEDGGLGRAPGLGVVVLKGEEQGLVGIAGKRPEILAGGEGPVPGSEGIVEKVKNLSGLGNLGLRRIVKLGTELQPHGVAHGHHSPDARGGGSGKPGGFEGMAAPDDKSAITLRIGAVLDAGEGLGIEQRRGRGAAPFILRDVGTLGEGGHGTL